MFEENYDEIEEAIEKWRERKNGGDDLFWGDDDDDE